MNELALAAYLTIKKPEFPTPQEIAITCEQSAPCAAVKAQGEERLRVEADLRQSALRLQPVGTYGNTYSYRQCTWYVASRLDVPSYMGNATNWSYGLANAGWRSGGPRRGAVGVSHAGWAGHVVVAEQVSGDSVLISEYNWVPYSYTERWVSASEYEWFFQ